MAWFVVRYYPDKYQPQENNKFYVEEGDIIKFGRVRFKIRKLRIQDRDSSGSYMSEEESFGGAKKDGMSDTIDDHNPSARRVAGLAPELQSQRSIQTDAQTNMMNQTMMSNVEIGNQNE